MVTPRAGVARWACLQAQHARNDDCCKMAANQPPAALPKVQAAHLLLGRLDLDLLGAHLVAAGLQAGLELTGLQWRQHPACVSYQEAS